MPVPAAHAGGDEYHVGACERCCDLLLALLGSLAADLRDSRLRPDPWSLLADLDLGAGLREVQRLHIRVYRNKFNALHAALDHAVYRIAAAAADADDFDTNYIIKPCSNSKPIVDILRFIVKDRTDNF